MNAAAGGHLAAATATLLGRVRGDFDLALLRDTLYDDCFFDPMFESIDELRRQWLVRTSRTAPSHFGLLLCYQQRAPEREECFLQMVRDSGFRVSLDRLERGRFRLVLFEYDLA